MTTWPVRGYNEHLATDNNLFYHFRFPRRESTRIITRLCLNVRRACLSLSLHRMFFPFGTWIEAICNYHNSCKWLQSKCRRGKHRCRDKERQALLTFKQSLVDNSGRLSSWGSENGKKDCCLWRGVRCSHRTGHVVMLDLHHPLTFDDEFDGFVNSSLRGKINPSLLELRYLRYLDLTYNDFGGTQFPNINGSLSKLRHLDLHDTGLSFTTLNQILNLSSLRYLDLSSNNLNGAKDWPQLLIKLPYLEHLRKIVDLTLQSTLLEGSIPDFFRNLVSLEHLDLSDNELGGEIPEFLGNICTLKTLDLSENYFSRFVPAGLSGCIQNSLEILSLPWNRFQNSFSLSYLTGPLPDLTQFSSLKYLDIGHNRFNGTVTESLGCLPELEHLDASWNSLEGAISEEHFENLSKLHTLDLSFNLLTFNVSSGWIPPFQLNQIHLSFCNLGPHFPKWLHTQRSFQDLDISGAGISDLSPVKLLTFIGIDLSSNLFEGPLPVFPYNVTKLILAKNRFSGSVSPLCKNTAGWLPDCFFHWQDIVVLNLANNNFSGVIPTAVGSLLSLETIKLHAWVGENLSSLIFLSLQGNEFNGRIPSNFMPISKYNGFWTSLKTFLSGAIPSCLDNLTAMVQKGDSNDITEDIYVSSMQAYIFFGGHYIEKAMVRWKGKEYEYERSLGLLGSLILQATISWRNSVMR
ncbi:probable LRR receptor-like serine/threonine-protein kinase At4g36180 [Durio zibethinus]|uniref:Probable LRR receptor-like serine/threonine-protein kinase At4g36180 n=1 Tax=Durio zibethinus TaxID=66656 RepID=A0A6P6AH70_DURZI|nr:probable LRR receptor-like serine/threonine-protein kinase At4g36180 [Durio zibethinus]